MPLTRLHQATLVVCLTAAVAACGGGSGGGGGNENGANGADGGNGENGANGANGANGSGDNGAGNGGATGAAARLPGTWESICHVTPFGSDNIISRTFDGVDTDVLVRTFESANGTCSGTGFPVNFVFSYQVGGEVTTSGGLSARALDVTLEEDPLGVFVGPEVSFDIFYIDSNDTLYFSVDAADSAVNRPTELNFAVPYSRQ